MGGHWRRAFGGLGLGSVLGLCAPLVWAASPPATMVAAGPTAVSAPAVSVLAVEVRDAAGQPVPNPQVSWQAPASGPSAALTALVGPQYDDIRALGYGIIGLTPVGGLGSYQVVASLAGVAPVVFEVTNTALAVAWLEVTAGADQSALVGAPFPEMIVVRARAADGAPVENATITFTTGGPRAGAVLSQPDGVTGADGTVAVSAVANQVSGLHAVVASAAGPNGVTRTVSARLSNLGAPPATIEYLRGDAQRAPTLGVFPTPLEVRLRDAGGAPVANAAVSFVGPQDGPGVEDAATDTEMAFLVPGGARVLTDAQGVARVFVQTNAKAGAYAVTASTAGVAASVSFSLVADPRLPSVVLGNGSTGVRGEVTTPGGRFDSLAFLVRDSFGDPLPGVSVQLEVAPSGPSVALDQTLLVTDSEGVARTGGTANDVPGTYALRARVEGVATTGLLLLQNRPPGYDVGEALADDTGLDDAGQERSLRGFVADGSFLLLDVCAGWCTFCRRAQPDSARAMSELAALGLPTRVVPLLAEGEQNVPSSQEDAAAWRAEFQLSEPVLHASSQLRTPFWEAAWFVLGVDDPGFPTYLLVGPDGTILARRAGVMNAAEIVEFVSGFAPPELRVADVSVSEGAGTASVTVVRSRTGAPASVVYATSPGSAGGADFSPQSGVLTFASDQDSASFSVPIVGDSLDEPDESFQVSLSAAEGAVIADGQASVTILDDDAPSSLSVDDVRVTEGSSGPSKVAIPVRLDRPSGFTITVKYEIVPGTATAKDVELGTGILKLAPGETAGQILAVVEGDKLVETKETFEVTLTGVDAAALLDASATVTIVDDDLDTRAPEIAQKAAVVVEVKMASKATVPVSYAVPAAKDDRDGALKVACSPASGSSFGYGTTAVRCSAEDRAGNLATSAFDVVVRLPSVSGAVFDRRTGAGPLDSVRRHQVVEVRVGAGAFRRHADVRLSFVDSSGRRFGLREGHAGRDGSLELIAVVPQRAELGPGVVLAESDERGEYDRAWFVTVVR